MKKNKIIPLCLATILTLQSMPMSSFANEIISNNQIGVVNTLDFVNGMSNEEFKKFITEFNNSLIEDGVVLPKERGVKSEVAKIAAKKMLKKLYKIGSKSFNKAVRRAASSLPKKQANYIIKNLTYQKVSAALNIVANMEGMITDALTKVLSRFMPSWIANPASRIIIFILL